ncbi:MAG: ECF-type sigma factor [Myxococcota bacterium]
MAAPTRHEVDALLPIVYDRLRVLADRYLHRSGSETLRPTALVHEAWMKLQASGGFEGEEHFRAVAAKAMRQILVDRARAKARLKRGENPVRTSLGGVPGEEVEVDVIDLNHALEELERVDPRGARVVELRFFGGLSVDEVATLLEVSPRTVAASWRLSRAWLVDRLAGGSATP